MIKYIAGAFALLLSLAASAQAPTVDVGQTAILTAGDNGNGNLLVAQAVTVTAAQAGTVQSESFYVTAASGNLVLALYDATGSGGKPGKLLAQTASFAPHTGWNTANLTTPPTIAAGNYWLAYAPSSNNLAFVKQNNSGSCYYYSRTFSATLPATFSTSPNNCTPTTWSLYMTIQPAAPPPPPPPPPAPTVSLNGVTQVALNWSSTNATGCTASGSWSGSEPLSGSAAVPITANDASYTLTCSGLGGTVMAMLSPTLSWPTAAVGGDFAFSLPVGSTLKFMDPNGNDSNDGLSATTCGTNAICGGNHGAWVSSAHNMNCGEVIIAGVGSYLNNNFSDIFGTVSNCPSTTGGIDNNGGIYFAIILCGGTEVSSSTTHGCQAGGSGGPSNPNAYIEMAAGQSNWAVEGFYMDGTPTTGNRGFGYRTCTIGAISSGKVHHLALINSIGYNLMGLLYSNDCGNNDGTAEGGDYIAGVGLLAVDSNRLADYTSNSSGAIAPGALTNWDTNAGTHIFLYNNYGPSNLVHGADTTFDGEFLYYDSPDAHHYTQTTVTANNLGYITTRWCFTITYNGGFGGPWASTHKVYNNTCLNGWDSASAGSPGGNIDLANNGCCPEVANPLTYVFQNNVSQTTFASGTGPGGATVYALNIQGHLGTLTFGGSGNENVLISTVPSCTAGDCDSSNFSSTSQTDTYPSGTNFYPAQGTTIFANVADLANHTGAPNCAGFETTTQCMGWDARTNTLTSNTFIADFQCVYTSCAGKGFQKPSTTCVTSGQLFNDYPVWLKGIVYLHWNGSTITEKAGLATKPCGM